MSSKGQSSRERITAAANRLVYIKGYNQTSFADVANEVGITKGNLHYHFKTKEEILESILLSRKDQISKNLIQWQEQYPDPKQRMERFVQMLLNEEQELVRYGCPMGTLNLELGKSQLQLRDNARELFDLFRSWLERAFRDLGRKDNKKLSNHLLSIAQGAVLLSHIYGDQKILKDECNLMLEWIDSIK